MDVPQIQAQEITVKAGAAWPHRRSQRGRRATVAAVGLILSALLVAPVAWSEPKQGTRQTNPVTSSRSLAEDQLRRARELVSRGDVALALSACTEALRLDPTLGAAYLELAGLRQRLNDAREAESLYSRAAMIHDVRGPALHARALIRRSDGRWREAVLDLEESVLLTPDPAALHTLAAWYVEGKNWPAALGVWRRLAGLRLASGDPAGLREAELSALALSVLAAEADPVTSIPERAAWVRRALAHIARKALSAPRSTRK